MPPKKKLSKKEKARLEAEQAELLRIEMEKEKQRKLEEERQRRQVEYEQAKQRQKQEIVENKTRRAHLKHSMSFFSTVLQTINGIKATEREEHDWEKYMRCNGLPNANSPSDLRKYLHQWQSDIEVRNRESRNWLLRTDERTLLTQDLATADLTRTTLRKQQGNLGDVYARRIAEVLGILLELGEVLSFKSKPPHIITDLLQLKTEIRVLVNEHLDEFTFKTMSHIERDMEIDRPGVSKHLYGSEVFSSHFWTFSKDAQISPNPKARIGEQNQHIEIDFPELEMQIALPPSVQLQSSAMRGMWLNYDHLSDYCTSFSLKKPRHENMNILIQTKKEWHKRKEILQNMLDDCIKESPTSTLALMDNESPTTARKLTERSLDVDKLYTEYEDELNKAHRRAIGPEAFGLLETDVNLRKYRIIGGVYCIDYLNIPQQDKRLDAKSFIRTITSPSCITNKHFFQLYKPPPPPQPGVRRLPEEIEAEMRMIEAALDKLALVTLQLPNSVIWFEPPIACRWETQLETLESDLTEGVKQATTTATPTEATPLSTTTNASPVKGSPRFTAKMRKRSSQKSSAPMKVREINDFDLFDMPKGVDMYSLLKDFVVPRLPQGFCVRFEKTSIGKNLRKKQKKLRKQQQLLKERVILLARHKNVMTSNPNEMEHLIADNEFRPRPRQDYITDDYLDLNEPREFFPCVKFEKVLKFKDSPRKVTSQTEENIEKKDKNVKAVKIGNMEEIGSEVTKNSIGTNETNGNIKESVVMPKKKIYMFSQLLEDLDRLCELQMPVQEEAALLNQISANLTSSTSSNNTNGGGSHVETSPTAGGGSGVAGNTEGDDKMLLLQQQQPTFAYYSDISFERDTKVKNDKEDKNETEEEESSSEYDDEYDDEEQYYVNANDDQLEEDTTMATLSSMGAGATTTTTTRGGTVAATMSSGGLHDFLSKHNQSESDSSDGKKSKTSNIAALTQGKWSTRDVHDTKFNEDKLSIQFRTGRLGTFGFALNRYSNMPYQTWEIKPELKSPGTILFSFTASIVSLDMTITSAGYCVNNFQGGSTDTINDMIGKILTLTELRDILITSAVDIFPDEDTFCYTEGSCEKNYVMEMHLYACMSTLALSHNFSWSRWNLLAGSRSVVLLMRELIEGKKVPYHSTLLVTPLKTAIIDCTEVSASFNSAGIAGMQYYADLYQLSQVYALPSSLEKQRTMDALLRDNIARILMAIRPLSFC